MSVLSERIKMLREEQGWSQIYVSDQLGLKRSSTHANWEYGIREPDIDTVVKLASLFGVTTDYLTGASDYVRFSNFDELDQELIQLIRSLSVEDKQYLLGFIKKIKKS